MFEDMNTGRRDHRVSNARRNIKSAFGRFEGTVDGYMGEKAPFRIPQEGKEFIASILPYVVILGIIAFIPALLALLDITTAKYSPFPMPGSYGMMGDRYGMNNGQSFALNMSLLASFIVFVLEVLAIPDLFNRKRSGWNLLFYASVVFLIGSALAFNVAGGIIIALIVWYILFQVKELYT